MISLLKIKIIGGILGNTGYDAHCRGLANALHEEGVYVKLDVPLTQDWTMRVNDAELLMINRKEEDDMIAVAIMLPHYWPVALADNPKKFYGFCVWEGDKIPKFWLDYLMDERVNGILVPSNHVRDAILFWDDYVGNFLKEKIHIIPHGVDMSLFKSSDNKEKNKFSFVCNKGWSRGLDDRGGMQYVIKAFAEEFRKDEDVRLLLKINPSYCGNGWNLEEEKKKLDLPEDRAEILVNNALVEYSMLPTFYHDGDVFVCASKAEAFNIPGLEAKACGLMTIQTGFGGQIDYMFTDCDLLTAYKLAPATEGVMYEGINWAEIDMAELRKHLRWCFENQDLVKHRNSLAREQASKFTWRNTARKLIEAIR